MGPIVFSIIAVLAVLGGVNWIKNQFNSNATRIDIVPPSSPLTDPPLQAKSPPTKLSPAPILRATPPVRANQVFPYLGDVAAVEPSQKTFTFRLEGGKELVFKVNTETEITMDNMPAGFTEIIVGAHVSGNCAKSGEGKVTALSVKIRPKSK